MSPSGTFVAVLGVGGHGLSIGSFLSAVGTRVVYLDDDPKGVPVEGDSERLRDPAFLKEYQIAIGIGDNAIRVFFSTVVMRHGGRLKMVKHNMATISPTAKKGIGCQYFPGAIVGANAQIGDFVIVNNKASVGHDSIVRDGAQIADGGTLGGGVVVGKCTLIGLNAVVLPKIKVGDNVIVGAGTVVTKDIADGKIVYGNPARSPIWPAENSKAVAPVAS